MQHFTDHQMVFCSQHNESTIACRVRHNTRAQTEYALTGHFPLEQQHSALTALIPYARHSATHKHTAVQIEVQISARKPSKRYT